MYTLKIKWWRTDPQIDGFADETTLFVPADEVHVHGPITADSQLDAWQHTDFADYRVCIDEGETGRRMDGRLISVTRGGKDSWYVASNAWLLGPDGRTIERLT